MEIGVTNAAAKLAAREGDSFAREACLQCGSRTEDECIALHGRCSDCLDVVEAQKRSQRARELAIRAAAESLTFRAYAALRHVVEGCEHNPTYRSVHGELKHLKVLATLGFVRCVEERVSRSPVASVREWVPTPDGRAVVSYRKLAAWRGPNAHGVA